MSKHEEGIKSLENLIKYFQSKITWLEICLEMAKAEGHKFYRIKVGGITHRVYCIVRDHSNIKLAEIYRLMPEASKIMIRVALANGVKKGFLLRINRGGYIINEIGEDMLEQSCIAKKIECYTDACEAIYKALITIGNEAIAVIS